MWQLSRVAGFKQKDRHPGRAEAVGDAAVDHRNGGKYFIGPGRIQMHGINAWSGVGSTGSILERASRSPPDFDDGVCKSLESKQFWLSVAGEQNKFMNELID